jgi:hypothetical protein
MDNLRQQQLENLYQQLNKGVFMFHFYVSDWGPNGTNDLIITDQDGTIVDSLSEAIFGVLCKLDPMGGAMHCNGVEVFYVEAADLECLQVEDLVYEFDAEYLLRHVAVSPVSNGSKAIAMIKKYSSKLGAV